jgi:diguanylate cyclase (GGDEF)-like protein
MAEGTVLVVDDSSTIREIVRSWLSKAGFTVVIASDGLEALNKLEEIIPDLILLDIEMPRLNGYDTCREIRNNLRTSNVPVIMLTSRADVDDKIMGLEFGADDYVTKPCDSRELTARVEANIRRSTQEREASPLTGLPGNVQIHDQIEKRIKLGRSFALFYLDIDNFKCFNDGCGFTQGDKVIRVLADMITDTVSKMGNPTDFVGHIGGDDFILISSPEKVDSICREIIQKFDSQVPNLYSEADRTRGYIYAENREGKKSKCGIMTLSIGVVVSDGMSYATLWDLVGAGAEAKRTAKKSITSSYHIEREPYRVPAATAGEME